MYKSLDLRRRVEIEDRYVEYRHLNPLHEVAKVPMLLGYPNLFAEHTLRLANDGLDDQFARADVILAREPWQIAYVVEHAPDDTPVVFSSHNVETERFSDIRQPAFADRTLDRVRRLERLAVEETDAIVCTSERDADVYRSQYDPGGEIVVAPNGTYEKNIRQHEPNSDEAERLRSRYGIPSGATVCLFLGTNYRPNVKAARDTLDIAEVYDRRSENVHFLIVGSVDSGIEGEVPPNATLTGYVTEDFEAHFDLADIALNPMSIGGGTNIKILDYFARGLSVVSTPFGGRGFDGDGETLVLAEIDQFVDAIDDLRDDPDRRRRIGEAARSMAESSFTWEATSRSLRETMVDLFGPF